MKASTALLIGVIVLAMMIFTITITPLSVAAAYSNPSTSKNTNTNSRSNNANRTTNVGQQSTIQSKISVVASFFPIYEFVKAVGGDRIDASVLIPIGAEPHDFDPTIQGVQKANSANLLHNRLTTVNAQPIGTSSNVLNSHDTWAINR
jgi:zinc transport system substrate-binding protein